MKIVFMGTPDFAVPALEALITGGHEIAAVVTQPDKPRGRGKAMAMPPVKEKALEHGIPVYQPERIRKDDAFFEILSGINPDVIVVIAFGQILPARILNLPHYGCINIHASLLPKYRGAAPIQWAVINGDRETGVTTMLMDEGLDTGDMLEKTVIALNPDETGGSLFDRLSQAGGALILETLKKVEAGTITRTKQCEAEATHVTMLDKAMGDLDWFRDASSLERLIRGLNPWPSAYTLYEGKNLKIWAAEVREEDRLPDEVHEVGCVVSVEKDGFSVQTGKGLLQIRDLQLEGKKRMDASAFLRGYPVKVGDRLGDGGLKSEKAISQKGV